MKINLTNQEIVKFAYITKEIIENTWGRKLTNAQANCYLECFYSMRDILEDMDESYIKNIQHCAIFFLGAKG